MDTRIIALLELQEEGRYLSGEVLSRELNISRTAVWKHIKKLEGMGYRIEASRRMGYRLLGKPSRLTMPDLMEKLKESSFVPSIKLLDAVDSTQNIAQRMAEEGAPEGTLVIAEQQTKGRGRMGRHWVSPPGKGVWMSMVLRPEIPLQFAPQLTLLAAVALSRALMAIAPLDIGIKWPNDLLIGGKKISGILLESTAEDERLRYVVAGIGISVNLEETDYPPELLEAATSLRIALGRPLERSEVIAAFISQFQQLYTLYHKEGFAPIRSLWEARSITLHKQARLVTPSGVVEGTPVGLDDRGALLVKLAGGEIIPVFSADIKLPAGDGGA
ncbi:biotin--[acetyl-CoA-carboxylase] ligase [Paenibacillus nasutitermitis]|uniref:Bifunctional ligase/repressor BirA n=1 Tax=Paenibacillus nasutitermitis TaxID=1652958 RepID=A0A917DU32_9BACL|nr:biotin--[acetyl-CoA-carboxylase] ligase [Paenibacillus nasutitermitis]GGD68968.1 bifunctional ligase/repressor BirA [Paenibacillus nasutitermitis]